jgi:hypothetical protein
MACPFFKPLRRLDAGGWEPAPRLPLGGAWGGECTAEKAGPSEHAEPSEAFQRELCNSGYAGGLCDRYAPGSRADAVRFSLSAEGRVIYILEKDYAPVEHGEIDPERDSREPLASQARAFLETLKDGGHGVRP